MPRFDLKISRNCTRDQMCFRDRRHIAIQTRKLKAYMSEPPAVAGGPYSENRARTYCWCPPATAGGSDKCQVGQMKNRHNHTPTKGRTALFSLCFLRENNYAYESANNFPDPCGRDRAGSFGFVRTKRKYPIAFGRC